jgi:hypothetical protein
MYLHLQRFYKNTYACVCVCVVSGGFGKHRYHADVGCGAGFPSTVDPPAAPQCLVTHVDSAVNACQDSFAQDRASVVTIGNGDKQLLLKECDLVKKNFDCILWGWGFAFLACVCELSKLLFALSFCIGSDEAFGGQRRDGQLPVISLCGKTGIRPPAKRWHLPGYRSHGVKLCISTTIHYLHICVRVVLYWSNCGDYFH